MSVVHTPVQHTAVPRRAIPRGRSACSVGLRRASRPFGIATIVIPTALVAVFASVLVPPALATEINYRSTEQVAAKSVYVVLAECMAVETRPVEKFGGNLFTFSDFRVEENIAGELDPEFTLRLFGGQQGDVFIDAPLMPRFRPGERVVLLLGDKNKDGYPIVSLQGVFRIRGDSGAGRGIVETPITELALFSAADGTQYANTPQNVTVDDFVYSLKKRDPRKQGGSTTEPAK